MADQPVAKGKGKTLAAPVEDGRVPTKRTILKRERVIVLPDGLTLTTDEEKALVAELKKHGIKDGSAQEAWLVVGEWEGESKRKAIEAFAGVPGTPQARPGVYKAPTSAAFAGGRLYERPPEPKIEGSDLVD